MAIRIDIASEFKDKGFKAAEKRTISLDRKFNQLTRSARRTFTAIAGIAALKRSVRAFAENDAAISNLTKSLDNLGFRFEAPGIVTYLENLEKTTSVVKDELFPAFRNLANATLDTQQAQELLNVALDISAGTGAELSSVTNALTRAYNGNFSSLGKIQNAYTMAELKAMGFAESVKVLQSQFSGQAAAAADTYQGKITRLNIALGDAAENLGKGVIDALEVLGSGNYDRGLELIAAAGEKVGDAFRFAAVGVNYFQRFWKQGLFASKDQLAEFRRDMDSMFREDPAKARTQLRERAKFLSSEVRQTEKIRKERAAAAKLAEKEKKDRAALDKARQTLDLERAQIEAALQGKITEEERTRLLLMRAILNEDAGTATELAAKLKEMQDETKKLATFLTSFPKANDPFEHWLNTLEKLHKSLIDIQSVTSQQNLQSQAAASAGNAAMAAGDYAAALAQSSTAKGDAIVAAAAASAAVTAATTPQEKASAESLTAAAAAANDAADLLAESVAGLAMEAATADLMASLDLYNESLAAARDAGAMAVTINMNIEGNVTAENDLVEMITDNIYRIQKTGKQILLSSIAI